MDYARMSATKLLDLVVWRGDSRAFHTLYTLFHASGDVDRADSVRAACLELLNRSDQLEIVRVRCGLLAAERIEPHPDAARGPMKPKDAESMGRAFANALGLPVRVEARDTWPRKVIIPAGHVRDPELEDFVRGLFDRRFPGVGWVVECKNTAFTSAAKVTIEAIRTGELTAVPEVQVGDVFAAHFGEFIGVDPTAIRDFCTAAAWGVGQPFDAAVFSRMALWLRAEKAVPAGTLRAYWAKLVSNHPGCDIGPCPV